MSKITHTIDAKGFTLGRLATKIALLLRGKDNPNFAPHIDPEATVKITNASALGLTGTKMDTKYYLSHSGYPGGQKKTSVKKAIEVKGYADLIRRAVRGMLPPNRMRAQILKRLIIEE